MFCGLGVNVKCIALPSLLMLWLRWSAFNSRTIMYVLMQPGYTCLHAILFWFFLGWVTEGMFT